jgi:hypothetical protein
MKPSEALFAWCDGRQLQVFYYGDWYDVTAINFDVGRPIITFYKERKELKQPLSTFEYRCTEFEPEPDHEAWKLLIDLVDAFDSEQSQQIFFCLDKAKDALKKKKMI